MHTSAFVAGVDVRKAVRRLENVATPYVSMVAAVQVDAFVLSTLDSDDIDSGEVQLVPDPARDVLVRRLRKFEVEVVVIEWSHDGLETTTELTYFGPRKASPVIVE
jgi:hypothetical protein